jgi:hypothetical protein
MKPHPEDWVLLVASVALLIAGIWMYGTDGSLIWLGMAGWNGFNAGRALDLVMHP